MDISIQLDHPKAIFSNGDSITGNVVIYCPASVTTVSKITATLVGESILSYTDISGLLIDRKQQDKHRVSTHSIARCLPVGQAIRLSLVCVYSLHTIYRSYFPLAMIGEIRVPKSR
jgi:hypothetical protein